MPIVADSRVEKPHAPLPNGNASAAVAPEGFSVDPPKALPRVKLLLAVSEVPLFAALALPANFLLVNSLIGSHSCLHPSKNL